MGSSCTCHVDCKSNDLVKEFNLKPLKTTLCGSSTIEESFIQTNFRFHSKNFSETIFNSKLKPRSASAVTKLRFSQITEIEVISPTKSVQEEETTMKNDAIYEGELEMYRPGAQIKYVHRWCRLSRDGFAYFKNHWAAICYGRPMFCVSFEQIEGIKQVENRIQKKNPEFFEFEIVLMTGKDSKKMVVKNEKYAKEVSDSERRLIFGTRDNKVFKQWIKYFSRRILCD
jgi:hypothetical protein